MKKTFSFFAIFVIGICFVSAQALAWSSPIPVGSDGNQVGAGQPTTKADATHIKFFKHPQTGTINFGPPIVMSDGSEIKIEDIAATPGLLQANKADLSNELLGMIDSMFAETPVPEGERISPIQGFCPQIFQATVMGRTYTLVTQCNVTDIAGPQKNSRDRQFEIADVRKAVGSEEFGVIFPGEIPFEDVSEFVGDGRETTLIYDAEKYPATILNTDPKHVFAWTWIDTETNELRTLDEPYTHVYATSSIAEYNNDPHEGVVTAAYDPVVVEKKGKVSVFNPDGSLFNTGDLASLFGDDGLINFNNHISPLIFFRKDDENSRLRLAYSSWQMEDFTLSYETEKGRQNLFKIMLSMNFNPVAVERLGDASFLALNRATLGDVDRKALGSNGLPMTFADGREYSWRDLLGTWEGGVFTSLPASGVAGDAYLPHGVVSYGVIWDTVGGVWNHDDTASITTRFGLVQNLSDNPNEVFDPRGVALVGAGALFADAGYDNVTNEKYVLTASGWNWEKGITPYIYKILPAGKKLLIDLRKFEVATAPMVIGVIGEPYEIKPPEGFDVYQIKGGNFNGDDCGDAVITYHGIETHWDPSQDTDPTTSWYDNHEGDKVFYKNGAVDKDEMFSRCFTIYYGRRDHDTGSRCIFVNYDDGDADQYVRNICLGQTGTDTPETSDDTAEWQIAAVAVVPDYGGGGKDALLVGNLNPMQIPFPSPYPDNGHYTAYAGLYTNLEPLSIASNASPVDKRPGEYVRLGYNSVLIGPPPNDAGQYLLGVWKEANDMMAGVDAMDVDDYGNISAIVGGIPFSPPPFGCPKFSDALTDTAVESAPEILMSLFYNDNNPGVSWQDGNIMPMRCLPEGPTTTTGRSCGDIAMAEGAPSICCTKPCADPEHCLAFCTAHGTDETIITLSTAREHCADLVADGVCDETTTTTTGGTCEDEALALSDSSMASIANNCCKGGTDCPNFKSTECCEVCYPVSTPTPAYCRAWSGFDIPTCCSGPTTTTGHTCADDATRLDLPLACCLDACLDPTCVALCYSHPEIGNCTLALAHGCEETTTETSCVDVARTVTDHAAAALAENCCRPTSCDDFKATNCCDICNPPPGMPLPWCEKTFDIPTCCSGPLTLRPLTCEQRATAARIPPACCDPCNDPTNCLSACTARISGGYSFLLIDECRKVVEGTCQPEMTFMPQPVTPVVPGSDITVQQPGWVVGIPPPTPTVPVTPGGRIVPVIPPCPHFTVPSGHPECCIDTCEEMARDGYRSSQGCLAMCTPDRRTGEFPHFTTILGGESKYRDMCVRLRYLDDFCRPAKRYDPNQKEFFAENPRGDGGTGDTGRTEFARCDHIYDSKAPYIASIDQLQLAQTNKLSEMKIDANTEATARILKKVYDLYIKMGIPENDAAAAISKMKNGSTGRYKRLVDTFVIPFFEIMMKQQGTPVQTDNQKKTESSFSLIKEAYANPVGVDGVVLPGGDGETNFRLERGRIPAGKFREITAVLKKSITPPPGLTSPSCGNGVVERDLGEECETVANCPEPPVGGTMVCASCICVKTPPGGGETPCDCDRTTPEIETGCPECPTTGVPPGGGETPCDCDPATPAADCPGCAGVPRGGGDPREGCRCCEDGSCACSCPCTPGECTEGTPCFMPDTMQIKVKCTGMTSPGAEAKVKWMNEQANKVLPLNGNDIFCEERAMMEYWISTPNVNPAAINRRAFIGLMGQPPTDFTQETRRPTKAVLLEGPTIFLPSTSAPTSRASVRAVTVMPDLTETAITTVVPALANAVPLSSEFVTSVSATETGMDVLNNVLFWEVTTANTMGRAVGDNTTVVNYIRKRVPPVLAGWTDDSDANKPENKFADVKFDNVLEAFARHADLVKDGAPTAQFFEALKQDMKEGKFFWPEYEMESHAVVVGDNAMSGGHFGTNLTVGQGGGCKCNITARPPDSASMIAMLIVASIATTGFLVVRVRANKSPSFVRRGKGR